MNEEVKKLKDKLEKLQINYSSYQTESQNLIQEDA
jgi:hypothetical protein